MLTINFGLLYFQEAFSSWDFWISSKKLNRLFIKKFKAAGFDNHLEILSGYLTSFQGISSFEPVGLWFTKAKYRPRGLNLWIKQVKYCEKSFLMIIA